MSECRRPTEINVGGIRTVTFSANGESVLSGLYGVHVWRVEAGMQMATMAARLVRCLAVSKDGRWIAAGTLGGDVHVWDASTYKQVFAHKGGSSPSILNGLDFSPDSNRLVTAPNDRTAVVWDIATRERVHTLHHEDWVRAAKYSPQGDRIATATKDFVRVHDSNDGRLLVDIKVEVTPWFNTGLLWFNNDLFVVSNGKIKQFEASTGSAVSELPVPDTDEFSCIAVPNWHGEFIAYAARRTVTFWDMPTHTQLGLVQRPQDIRSIALSPDDLFIAIGGWDGKIAIESLSRITASTRKQDDQTLTSGGRDSNPPDPTPEEHGEPGLVEPESNNEDRGIAHLFDYDEEPPSPTTSTHAPEDQVPPPGPSRPVLVQSLDFPPGEHLDATKSSQRSSMFRRWLPMRTKRAHAVNEGPPRTAAGKHQRRTIAKFHTKPQREPPKAVAPKDVFRNTSHRGRGAADLGQAGAAGDASDLDPAVGSVHVMRHLRSGRATIGLTLPEWMLCFSGDGDGTH